MKSARAEKVYYAIGEVAEMFQVNTSLIRFWEKEFEVLKPKKNKKGNRLFTEKDVRYLHMIYHLVKEKGYTLQGARDAIKEQSDALETKIRLIETLTQTKQFLQQLDAALAEKLKKA